MSGFNFYTDGANLPNFMGDGGFYQPEVNPFENNFGIDYGFGQGGGTTQNNSNSGFFGDITAGGLLKGLAPIGASLIGGDLANKASRNYGLSSLAAIKLTKAANEDRARQNFAYGNLALNKNAAMRIQDANQQLAMQNSAPFRNKATLDAARRIGGSGVRGSDALAGRLQFMFA